MAPVKAQITVGPPIGSQTGNIGTPFTLHYLALDPANTQNTTNPFLSTGNVLHPTSGLCDYSGATPTRVSYSGGSASIAKLVAPMTLPLPTVDMAPFYFPLTYTSSVTSSPNTANTPANGSSATPIIGLFDWRPKDLDEALVVAESDDNGVTWNWMQTVLELRPGNSVCPANPTSSSLPAAANGSTADNGWGHAAIIQLPGYSTQMLYMLNRDPRYIDSAPLNVIQLTPTNKFPIFNTNNTDAGGQDINAITTAVTNTPSALNPVVVKQTVGLLHPDGIMAVVPNTDPAKPATVLYVEKILDGDKTAMPLANQCKAAPYSGKTNHDISNVRLATTTDGINFVDKGIVQGLNDPTTVDYNKTRWISPRGTLIDVNGDGSLWGLLFAGGNCLDGDSDAFHYIGYAESTDLMNWTVYNDINSPIASINSATYPNQTDGKTVTVPANKPLIPTQPWFAQRLYAPSAVQIDSTHLSMTFAGYAVQTPNSNLLDYRQIGNVVLTTSKALKNGPNNINNQ
ncbi:MAG: hypothetical protein FWD62_04105 [Betaproteobacteria bacterium]|nr:hypothetical protein [Betaproteobacteria bacterium]